jgi:ferredoxin
MYKVDKQTCMGCAICVQTCPKGMRMGYNGIAEIIDQNELEKCGGRSICPMGSILGAEEESGSEGVQRQPQRPFPFASRARPGMGPGMGRGMGRGMGPGMGRGMGRGVDQGRIGSGERLEGGRAPGFSWVCVCPNCGNRETHQVGQPCYQRRCPVCGARMRME